MRSPEGLARSTVAAWARKWIPADARSFLQRFVSLTAFKLRHWEAQNPLRHVVRSDENRFGSPCRLAIVKNAAQYHRHFVAACLELGVPFQVIDLSGPDWLEQVRNSGCGGVLAWPEAFLSTRLRMHKERLEIIERVLGLALMPSASELWFYEDKRRMAYWMEAMRVPHARTWVFHDRGAAEDFVNACALPVVFKTAFGASAKGVRIVRRRSELRRLARLCFSRGVVPGGYDRRDRETGSLLLQEYLPDAMEWRMVRIGDSFFGHGKGRVGDFHSGSGAVLWDVPDRHLFDLLFETTEKGGFRSMNVDVFETPDRRLLVNELQAVFGAGFSVDQTRVDGRPGRFVRGARSGEWTFEEGDFARNACANERVRDLVGRLSAAPRDLGPADQPCGRELT